ncbi:MAG: outer membrane cobalamin receptor [Cyclobacteriaceae bacterium]|jgi:outer membrane cobalamin receptor
MKSKILAVLFAVAPSLLLAQTITGRVIENDLYKTPLFGATVIITELGRGQVTGLSGHFEIANVPTGNYTLKVTFVGYKDQLFEVTIPTDDPLDIAMEEDVTQLEGVEVAAKALPSIQAEQTKLSTIRVSDLPLADMPRLLGEPDLIRMIQNLPGVKTESDFTGGFSVRGGRNDQNLILLDGVPVYNPWHLFGLFSAFNTEAIERVELTKGVFPSQYGSRVSSVLDIELQKGDTRLGAGYLTISPISTTFSYGRPLNQKTSYLFAIRRTYLDPIFWGINAAASSQNARSKTKTRFGYNFMDLNAKVVHTFKPGLSLETGFFAGNDVLDFGQEVIKKESPEILEERIRYGWTNLTGSVKLIRKLENSRSTSHLFVSRYYADNIAKYNETGTSQDGHSFSGIDGFALTSNLDKQRFRQDFTDLGLQQDFNFYLNENITLAAGAQALTHIFREASSNTVVQWGYPFEFGSGSSQSFTEIPESQLVYNYAKGDTLVTKAVEASAYLNASISYGKLSFYPGLRLHHYTKGSYTYLLPRVNVAYQINDHWYVSAGYGHFTQYLQTVGFDLLRLPAERWFWAGTQGRKPVFTKTYTAGLGYDHDKLGKFTIEGYYKTFDNLLNFTDKRQAEALESELIPLFGSETVSGSGEAYGGEFLWQKTTGDIRGWLGYTLSWVWNEFDELNNGERFPSRTDKRHDIQTFWTYDFATNWSIGLLFNYKTGQPLTLNTSTYLYNSDPLDIGDSAGESEVIPGMNNFRLPAYHRLDMSLTWKNRKTFKHRSELSLNVVNVYNRLNVLTATNGTSAQVLPNGKVRIDASNKYSGQMPIIPMLSLRIALGGDAK